jgi:replicative superfamily II helicase
MGSDASVVVAAPTGAGKTVVMELGILRLLTRSISPTGQLQHQPGSLKAVYLAPAKALVQEKAAEWTQRFGRTLNLSIQEVTGKKKKVIFVSLASFLLKTDFFYSSSSSSSSSFFFHCRRHRSR